jgi:hypothetical protein
MARLERRMNRITNSDHHSPCANNEHGFRMKPPATPCYAQKVLHPERTLGCDLKWDATKRDELWTCGEWPCIIFSTW